MKRVGFIFEKICSLDNILLAMNNASKGKKKHPNVKPILENKEKYARELQEKLLTGTLQLSNNPKRIIVEGHSKKEREITTPRYYPDQVVHWALMQQLSPILFKGMYEYNCGSIPNRGGALARKYIKTKIMSNKRTLYVAKLDIKKFFPNIDLDKLKSLFRLKIKDAKALNLIDTIIDNGAPGLPIGYYTSQWFSNFYLEKLDHYIKESLHIKYYIRYVDDLVLVDYDKTKLHEARKLIGEYLQDNKYGVWLKDTWTIFKWNTQPIDFIGYRFYRYIDKKTKQYILTRKHIYYKVNRKLRQIRKRRYCSVDQARSLLSLEGWLKGSSSYHAYCTFRSAIITKRQLSKIISNSDKGVA